MTSPAIYFGLTTFLRLRDTQITNSIIFQDNMSSLSLEKNGHASRSKRTKHIKARYFFTKHYYDSGEIDLRYCPTKQMWADVLTKPLQGSKFREMRAILMNCLGDNSEEPLFLLLEPLPSSITNNHPMKPRIDKIVPSPREYVEVSPPSARPRTLCTSTYTCPKVHTSTHPKVTRKDSVPHNHRSIHHGNSALLRDLFRIPIVTE